MGGARPMARAAPSDLSDSSASEAGCGSRALGRGPGSRRPPRRAKGRQDDTARTGRPAPRTRPAARSCHRARRGSPPTAAANYGLEMSPARQKPNEPAMTSIARGNDEDEARPARPIRPDAKRRSRSRRSCRPAGLNGDEQERDRPERGARGGRRRAPAVQPGSASVVRSAGRTTQVEDRQAE